MKRLLFASLFASSLAFSDTSFWTPVKWENPQGVLMVGAYHAASSPDHVTWVLMHGLGSTKEEWDAFARALAGHGEGVFVFDAPGHGKSQRLAGGAFYDYKSFDLRMWAQMPEAFSDAVQVLEKKFHLAPERVAVGGASLGANVALVVAGDTPSVPRVLLLSPGMEYAGISVERIYSRYSPRELCMVASPGDTYAAQTVRALALRRTDPALKLIEGPGAAHGVNMLDAATTERILSWIISKEKK